VAQVHQQGSAVTTYKGVLSDPIIHHHLFKKGSMSCVPTTLCTVDQPRSHVYSCRGVLGETMNVYSEGVSSFVPILDPTIQKVSVRVAAVAAEQDRNLTDNIRPNDRIACGA
jgi:hypothetical protein